jgi:RepB DNA-primase from phage plasmid
VSDTHYCPTRGPRKNDRTATAVGLQLGAMACAQYEVGVYDASARRMAPRLLTADGIMSSLGWLKHKNAGGVDIYVRPFGSVGLLLVDDVTPASLKQLYADGLDPAAVVMTSPDNYQAWVRIAASPIGEGLATAAARELARCYGADLAAAKWRQYGRLAGFTNRKPKHRQADGRYPFVLFVVGRRGVAPAATELLSQVADQVDASVVPRRGDVSFSAPRTAIVCVLVDEYRRAVHDHCQRYQVDDWSRLDWMVTYDLAVAHPEATAAELAHAIAQSSPNVGDRHRGRVEAYALHTASKVLALSPTRS